MRKGEWNIKTGAFYVEFIFHAWVTRDIFSSAAFLERVGLRAEQLAPAFVQNSYFSFLDLFIRP